jgi:hypothetical protein
VRSPLFDRVAYAVVAALLGGTASVATHQVKDAEEIATNARNGEKIAKLEAELSELRGKMYERVRKEEEAREAIERHLHDRLIVVETKLSMR